MASPMSAQVDVTANRVASSLSGSLVIHLVGIFLGANAGSLGLDFTGRVTALVLADFVPRSWELEPESDRRPWLHVTYADVNNLT